ncbi:helix-turn-helix transcriptional regulator [bacterium]|nr:helix-turn-helix transcriptional regulator [bacterium]
MSKYKSDTEGNLMNLSARESAVLALVASGHSYKEIGIKLKISTRTVQTYMDRSIFKLQANSRSNAIAKYIASHNSII